MAEKVYEKLVDALILRGGTIPPQKTEEFYTLIEELFTAEDADLASKMPLKMVTAEDMAKETGRESGELHSQLEAMADKGLLFSTEKEGVIRYFLPPLAPGIFEFQFMRGTFTEHDKKLAHLFHDYHEKTIRNPEFAKKRNMFPFSRVISVEETVSPGVVVHTYDKVSHYIKNAKYIAVSPCFCRHQGELIGNPCDKPKETCFSFGLGAKYAADRNMGRLVTAEEALKILDQCEKAGLVHCTSNVTDEIDFLCNCCICHCAIIQNFKDPNQKDLGAKSGYIAKVNEDSCTGCGLCVEMCPIDAISPDSTDTVEINTDICIGCGLCASECPENALEMTEREELPKTPENRIELMMTMMDTTQKG